MLGGLAENATGSGDQNRRSEPLSSRSLGVNLSDDVHPGHDAAKSGKPLAVRVTPTPEIEFRLVPDTDEKLGSGGVRPGPVQTTPTR